MLFAENVLALGRPFSDISANDVLYDEIHPFSAGTVFIRQNPTSVDVRF